jgi:hypothetical protein
MVYASFYILYISNLQVVPKQKTRSLIQVNVPARPAAYESSILIMEVHMPIDSIMVAIASVAIFATIAFVIAWGDRQTRDL